ncbi:hypothetical protein ILYODFUR_000057 [Ilyodon furcidens]|uniref:Uncharacterized protein n=1 Tax=Ilyodon furcidens TaxID=33524 RepID=A0ABV0SW10_9TELE
MTYKSKFCITVKRKTNDAWFLKYFTNKNSPHSDSPISVQIRVLRGGLRENIGEQTVLQYYENKEHSRKSRNNDMDGFKEGLGSQIISGFKDLKEHCSIHHPKMEGIWCSWKPNKTSLPT